jgi:hypothetical protein
VYLLFAISMSCLLVARVFFWKACSTANFESGRWAAVKPAFICDGGWPEFVEVTPSAAQRGGTRSVLHQCPLGTRMALNSLRASVSAALAD